MNMNFANMDLLEVTDAFDDYHDAAKQALNLMDTTDADDRARGVVKLLDAVRPLVALAAELDSREFPVESVGSPNAKAREKLSEMQAAAEQLSSLVGPYVSQVSPMDISRMPPDPPGHRSMKETHQHYKRALTPRKLGPLDKS